MATLDEKEYSTDFSGLTSTAITAVVFLSAGIILEVRHPIHIELGGQRTRGS